MFNPSYTLITGASEGFGKALSLECAGRGMNLILVALPGEALTQLANYIEREFSVDVIHYGCDLSNREDCVSMLDELSSRQLDVNILINNAGIGGTHYFNEKDPSFYMRQIALNVTAPTLLTYFFLQQRSAQPAHILNVSSLAQYFCLPQKQVYGGTKSYIVSFSRSLRKELFNSNVTVSVICPGGMNTTLPIMLQNRSLSGLGRWSVMNPENVARIAIDGMLKGKEIILPGFWNRQFVFFDKLLPAFIKERMMRNQIKQPAQLNLLGI